MLIQGHAAVLSRTLSVELRSLHFSYVGSACCHLLLYMLINGKKMMRKICHYAYTYVSAGQVLHSQFIAKPNVHKDIPFRAQKVIADTNGRFILVLGQLFANPIVLVTFGHIILNNQYSSSPSPSLFKDRI